MARPQKQGIDYFPLDIDLDKDDKLQMVIAEHGSTGELLYIKLLAWIYGHEGYYTTWDEATRLKFAYRYSYVTGGTRPDICEAVVQSCLKWDIFCSSFFPVLTSKRIQTTWLTATRKRKAVDIKASIRLVGADNTEEIPLIPEETQDNAGSEPEEAASQPEETPQSKVKKTKEDLINELKSRADKFKAAVNAHSQYPPDMLADFYRYWTEPNKSLTKLRWELEKTWDTGRRLTTWAARARVQTSQVTPQINIDLPKKLN